MTTTAVANPGTLTGLATRAVGATLAYGTGPTAVVALDDISVDIRRGRFTAIMGPSGSGKSTLMHALAGLDTVFSRSEWFTGPAPRVPRGRSRVPVRIS